MIKYRPHCGGLAEAMERVVNVSSIEDLLTHIDASFGATPENITIEPYGYDKRIEWNTHLVCVDGKAIGYTDGKL